MSKLNKLSKYFSSTTSFGSMGGIIAGLFTILVLVGGIGAGVILTQRSQDIREQASTGPVACPDSWNEVCDTDAGFVPVSEGGNSHCCQPGELGCYECEYCIESRAECKCDDTYGCGGTWDYGDHCLLKLYEDCKPNDSKCCPNKTTNTPTPTLTPTPVLTGQCQDVKAYSLNWVLLSSTELGQLDVGDSLYYCVRGSLSYDNGSFDKARFTINNVLYQDTVTLRPGTTNEFCQIYTTPAGVYNFAVFAEIHHTILGWLE